MRGESGERGEGKGERRVNSTKHNLCSSLTRCSSDPDLLFFVVTPISGMTKRRESEREGSEREREREGERGRERINSLYNTLQDGCLYTVLLDRTARQSQHTRVTLFY